MAKEGSHLIMWDNNEHELDKLHKELIKEYRNIIIFKSIVDLASEEEIIKNYKVAMKLLDRNGFFCVINNAGVWKSKLLSDMTTSEYIHTFKINVFAPVAISKLIIPDMIVRNEGKFFSLIKNRSHCKYMFNSFILQCVIRNVSFQLFTGIILHLNLHCTLYRNHYKQNYLIHCAFYQFILGFLILACLKVLLIKSKYWVYFRYVHKLMMLFFPPIDAQYLSNRIVTSIIEGDSILAVPVKIYIKIGFSILFILNNTASAIKYSEKSMVCFRSGNCSQKILTQNLKTIKLIYLISMCFNIFSAFSDSPAFSFGLNCLFFPLIILSGSFSNFLSNYTLNRRLLFLKMLLISVFVQ